MMYLIVIFAFFESILLCQTKIPDFIHVCKKNDPNLNECALKNARIAIPEIVKGYKPYGLPTMIPLHIPRIDIQAGSNLHIDLTNNEVYGLENTWITSCDLQMENRHMIFKVTIPSARIVGHYKMNGRILILPIQGEGLANVSLVNGNYIYNMDFTFTKRKQNNYLTITNHNISFTTTRAHYYFENLFNGDPRLGEEMNKFLDENWIDVTKDLGSTVAETISSIITSIAQSIFSQVPFEEVLPEN